MSVKNTQQYPVSLKYIYKFMELLFKAC